MPKTILVVEDEENLVELIQYRLEANGYRVETALDGEEGLSKIRKLKPDLVILDIMMPKMHGFEVCRLVKEDEETRDIPIVILTAHAQQGDIKRVKEAGADSYVTKPFESEDLLNTIRKLLHEGD